MPAPEQNARPYQFQLRSLFVLMFVVSIYVAIMAPFLRTASLKQLLGILLFWVSALAAYVLMAEKMHAEARRNQSAHRGASLLRLPTRWRKTKAVSVFCGAQFGSMHLLVYDSGSAGPIPFNATFLYGNVAMMGAATGQMIHMCLYAARRRSIVEFFEGGVFTRGGYSPWSDLRGWVVKKNQPGRLTLRLKLDRVTLRLDEQQMQQARQILEQYLPGKNQDIASYSPTSH